MSIIDILNILKSINNKEVCMLSTINSSCKCEDCVFGTCSGSCYIKCFIEDINERGTHDNK